jgi:crotonobetainyl-CoA:carnitine CoA-transferase CaiB-like acyl-CoA transferase
LGAARPGARLGGCTTREDFDKAFVQKTAEEWEQWAKKRDLPLAALRDIP